MKKLFFLFSMILATSVAFAANLSGDDAIPGVAETNAANPVAGEIFFGTIGGDRNCTLQMPYGASAGFYSFHNYTRVTRFGSYNAKTRTLVINAYEERTGKYVGKFVGQLTTIAWGLHRYKGVFTNYKGGKVNFNLEEQPHD